MDMSGQVYVLKHKMFIIDINYNFKFSVSSA